MFRIGYRTVKTAVGTGAAVFIAQLFGLEFYSSAGILVILCVQNTKRKSLQASLHRFLACLLSMVFSFCIFETIGYTPLAISLLLLTFIPTAVMLKIQEGIVTSSVIVMHLYSLKHITWLAIGNEIAILTIGISVALLVNMYMPSAEKKLKRYQEKVEWNFKTILFEMAVYLRNRDSTWAGKELIETEDILKQAKELSFKKLENQFMREDDYYYRYFDMRIQQFEILERIMPLAASLSWSYEQSDMIAEVIGNVGNSIRPESTGLISLRQLQEMREIFREMPLPKTREEFEMRAKLVQLVYEMEQYLLIKSRFKGKDNVKELI
ncbi:aromatic acid exporter family protein [Bacillus pseudomycoides]|uniref:aromatic acid exporter family protein n=1 Tax=Bacillus TaxID=1386 RepID=UPI002248BC1E|nr:MULTISPECIES: aromatic acid exporter family protein [Bacillus]MCX2825653.1 aromatic acid exporter family protein [Bacillus sp. DHT2]MDR4918231.1 aromatic acid exporter family protein [Bacillus pseudomycoides]